MAHKFNGSTSKLVMNGLAGIAYPFSFFCQIRPDAASASGMVLGMGDFGGADELLIFADGAGPGGKVKAFARDSLGSTFAASSNLLSAAGYLPALAVYQGPGNRTMYYGAGAPVTSTDVIAPVLANLDRLVVGCRGITDTLFFAGDIAHPAIWLSALSASDFAALTANAVPDTVQNSTLFDYWSLATAAATQVGVKGHTLTATAIVLSNGDPLTGTPSVVSGLGGIASGEAIGAMTVAADSPAPPASVTGVGGIASAEAVGTTLVTSNSPASPVQLVSDGIWTWYTDPRAVFRNGATYWVAVDSAGTCKIHKYVHATRVTTSAVLSSVGLEKDDHNNGSILFLPSGRIVAFYGLHNDPIIRYKVSNGVEDILGGWSAEQQRGGGEGDYSYPSPYILAQDPSKHYIFNRRWTNSTGSTRTLSFRTAPDLGTVPATLSPYTDVILEPNARPYVKSVSNGLNRIDVCATSAHPAESTYISVNHFYMQLDGSNVMRYYTTAGVEITTLPMPISAMTRVDDGSNLKRWNSDITLGADGHPRILWMRYPNNNGTDIRYMHSRWTGSAWVTVELCADGSGLYSAEQYYHGGLCFDSMDSNKVYLSAPIAGVRQIQEWRSADNGATWAKYRDLTSGGAAGAPLRLRPYSPRGHDGSLPVLWCEGTYNTFSDYNTAVMGLRSAGDAPTVPASITGFGGVASGEALGVTVVSAVLSASVSGLGGIASGEAIGAMSVSTGTVFPVTGFGAVPSAEALGTMTVTASYSASVLGIGGISSMEAIGSMNVTSESANDPPVFGSLCGTRWPSRYPQRPANV